MERKGKGRAEDYRAEDIKKDEENVVRQNNKPHKWWWLSWFKQRSRSREGVFFSIRNMLIIVIGFLVLASILASWGIQYSLTNKGVDNLTTQLKQSVAVYAQGNVESILDEARLTIGTYVDSTDRSLVRFGYDAPLAGFAQKLVLLPHISVIAYAGLGGSMSGARRVIPYEFPGTENDTFLYFLANATANTVTYYHIVEEAVGAPVITVSNFSIFTRDWYKLGLTLRNEYAWTAPYVTNLGHLSISAVYPIPLSTTDNTTAGMISVTLYIEELRILFAQLALGPGGHLAVIDDVGHLIVDTCNSADVCTTLSLPLLKYTNSSLYKKVDKYINRRFGGYAFIIDQSSTEIDDHWVYFRDVSAQNLKWTAVILMERKLVMKEIRRANRITLVVALAILVTAVTVATIMTCLITRPVRKIIRKMERISNFQVEEEDPAKKKKAKRSSSRSKIFEIFSLQNATAQLEVAIRSFEKFVPTAIVREIVSSSATAALGVELRVATVLFSDIANFTTLSEQLKPDVLVKLLGEYLEEMSHVIDTHQGTIDKFIGDAIMALWNAPKLLPERNHAVLACDAALACQSVLTKLREDWQGRELPHIHTRIGISTGDMLVGIVGSPQRMSYTAIGDNVNLGSRLESLCKYYGVNIIICHNTYEDVKEKYLCRLLDNVVVKGKSEARRIYELVAEHSAATEEQLALCDLQQQAVNALIECQLERARDELTTLRGHFPNDKCIDLLQQRCLQICANPALMEQWEGFYVLGEK